MLLSPEGIKGFQFCQLFTQPTWSSLLPLLLSTPSCLIFRNPSSLSAALLAPREEASSSTCSTIPITRSAFEDLLAISTRRKQGVCPISHHSSRFLILTSDKALAARGVEVVKADLNDVESLKKAFEGVHGVFGLTNCKDLRYEG